MNSQIRFVMHPKDEEEFIDEILKDSSITFIDGPRWETETPRTSRDITFIKSDYCILWSPEDVSSLKSEFIPTCNDWYCRSEHQTIQFLRSTFNNAYLLEGRIAINTDSKTEAGLCVEKRFKYLRKFIKKNFTNSVISWIDTNAPVSQATTNRSANPSKPDNSLWVAPHALNWLQEQKGNSTKQLSCSSVEGRLI